MADLEFFLDPACPFCWITSKWVRVVQAETDIEVRWSFISLVTLNEPYDDPDAPMARAHAWGRRAHRVLAAAADAHGDAVVGPLYEAIGELAWEADGPSGGFDRVLEELTEVDLVAALERAGLPGVLADAADDPSGDERFEASTREALARTGEDVGTPILTFDPDGEQPSSFFGPVISDVPAPAEAVAFYRALETASRIPSFSELKRTTRQPPQLPMLSNLG